MTLGTGIGLVARGHPGAEVGSMRGVLGAGTLRVFVDAGGGLEGVVILLTQHIGFIGFEGQFDFGGGGCGRFG